MSKKFFRSAFLVGILLCAVMIAKPVSAKNYTLTTTKKPYKNAYTKEKSYNNRTKHYYLLRSYLELLEKQGGGTLTLKKGTYNIPSTLYIPSKVTIKLKNGAVIKKTAKTGSKKLLPGKSLFELVPTAKSTMKAKVKGYNSSTGVIISGTGTAAINLNNMADSSAFIIGHNNNISISGINFKKMNGESFIVCGSSKNITIDHCTFTGYQTTGSNAKQYAIRLETPDGLTGSFDASWSKPNKYPTKNVNITSCVFNNVYSAIGSSKYTAGKFHTKVNVSSNTFKNITGDAIKVINWKNSVITNNAFSKIGDISNENDTSCGVFGAGSANLSISANTFDNMPRAIFFAPYVNEGAGSSYSSTVNTRTAANLKQMATNIVTNTREYYVLEQNSLTGTNVTRLLYFEDLVTKDYTVSPGGSTYRDMYTDYERYNSYTRDYYMIKSYLEQLEKVGGGTLTLTAGTYNITNTLFVPSNTTIILKDGVNMQKGSTTGFSNTVFKPSYSIFQLVPPSMAQEKNIYTQYNGAHDIAIIGEGTARIDMMFYDDCTAVIMGHNKNILIRNVDFYNYMGHHFIELDASQNVIIENCLFSGSRFTNSSDNYKEAINIDTPDKNTNGFNHDWSSYDRTANDNIVIRNNSFIDSLRAIGTHKYSVSPLDGFSQMYHTGIQILNNSITNTNGYAIRSINWKDCTIKGNTFKNINNGEGTAILMSGCVNPTITENTFDTASRPITINSEDNTDSALPDKAYPATHSILDSIEATGKNISAMLNNMLIDIKTTNIRYLVNGRTKDTAEKTLYFKFDSDHIKYTKPTATPAPTKDPGVTPDPDSTAAPSEAPVPTADPDDDEPDFEEEN